MENYTDTWDHQSICGVDLSELHLEDGHAILRVKVTDCLNYSRAKLESKTVSVKPEDLHSFIAGLTICPQGIGNGVDCEVSIELQTNEGFVKIEFDDENENEDFHDPYVYWTDDGVYDDPELAKIQERVQDKTTPANLETHKKLESGGLVLAMDIDGFVSLFKRNLPLSFIQGLETFQELSQSCETCLSEL